MKQGDQPRSDLDTAIDAVVPSLTIVGDAAAADSLRRTRTALAEGRREGGLGAWRWAIPAAVMLAAAIAAGAWWATVDGPTVVIRDDPPPAAPGPLPAAPPRIVAVAPTPPRVHSTHLARPARVEATSTTRADDTPRPDPLAALVRAVQEIPEDAWRASVARADTPVAVPDIDLAPIDTPPLGDVLVEPIAPGEP